MREQSFRLTERVMGHLAVPLRTEQEAEYDRLHAGAIRAGQLRRNEWMDLGALEQERRAEGWTGRNAEVPPVHLADLAAAHEELWRAEVAERRTPVRRHEAHRAAVERVAGAGAALEAAERDAAMVTKHRVDGTGEVPVWHFDAQRLGEIRAGQVAEWYPDSRALHDDVRAAFEEQRRAAGWTGNAAQVPPEDVAELAAARQELALAERDAQSHPKDADEARRRVAMAREAMDAVQAGRPVVSAEINHVVDSFAQEREEAAREVLARLEGEGAEPRFDAQEALQQAQDALSRAEQRAMLLRAETERPDLFLPTLGGLPPNDPGYGELVEQLDQVENPTWEPPDWEAIEAEEDPAEVKAPPNTARQESAEPGMPMLAARDVHTGEVIEPATAQQAMIDEAATLPDSAQQLSRIRELADAVEREQPWLDEPASTPEAEMVTREVPLAAGATPPLELELVRTEALTPEAAEEMRQAVEEIPNPLENLPPDDEELERLLEAYFLAAAAVERRAADEPLPSTLSPEEVHTLADEERVHQAEETGPERGRAVEDRIDGLDDLEPADRDAVVAEHLPPDKDLDDGSPSEPGSALVRDPEGMAANVGKAVGHTDLDEAYQHNPLPGDLGSFRPDEHRSPEYTQPPEPENTELDETETRLHALMQQWERNPGSGIITSPEQISEELQEEISHGFNGQRLDDELAAQTSDVGADEPRADLHQLDNDPTAEADAELFAGFLNANAATQIVDDPETDVDRDPAAALTDVEDGMLHRADGQVNELEDEAAAVESSDQLSAKHDDIERGDEGSADPEPDRSARAHLEADAEPSYASHTELSGADHAHEAEMDW